MAVGLTDLLPGEVAARVPEEVLLGAVEEHLAGPSGGMRPRSSRSAQSGTRCFAVSSTRHSSWRSAQSYSVAYEDESLRRFLDGEDLVVDAGMEEWLDIVRCSRCWKAHGTSARGGEPLSDYMRYELTWWYPANVAAGKTIRIIPVRKGQWPAGLPKHDFWLYDSNRVGILHYDPAGHLYRGELVHDPVEVVRHNAWRDVAMHQAIPWSEYLSKYPDLQAHLRREWKRGGWPQGISGGLVDSPANSERSGRMPA